MLKNFLAILLFLGVFACAGFSADTLRFELATKTGRPWREIRQALEDQFEWRISFEDAPVQEGGGPIDTTLTPTGLTMTGHRALPVKIDVSAASTPLSKSSLELKRQFVEAALAAHNNSGNTGMFRAIYDGDFIHIVPASFRDGDGTVHNFQPMLDTKVTIPRGTYSLDELVNLAIGQVSQRRGIQIVLGTIPGNLFSQSNVTEEANEEPVRDLFVRAFEEINGPRLAAGAARVRLSWMLLYDSRGRQYFFNVDSAPNPSSAESDLSGNNPQSSAATGFVVKGGTTTSGH